MPPENVESLLILPSSNVAYLYLKDDKTTSQLLEKKQLEIEVASLPQTSVQDVALPITSSTAKFVDFILDLFL